MLKQYGELDIKLKRNLKKKKATKSKSNKKARTGKKSERMSTRIILDFLRFNVFVFGLMLFVYLLVFLAARQYDYLHSFILGLIERNFPYDTAILIKENSFLFVLIIYFVIFLFICFGYSISTLKNFDKTWRSLRELTTDEAEVAKFSKNFSDVEIALKDIQHNVFKNQQIAALAESRKDDLVMYLAHDLKTPLTSVIGYLTLLDEAPELPTAQRAKYIGITLNKAYRLEQLINEFFEITRFNLQSITLENNRIDLGLLLNQITDEFYPMFMEKNVDYNLDINEKIIMYADSDKIARVLDNLLKNAVNYCYRDSTIHLGARIIGDNVVIKVRNKCDEIPSEKLDRLFEKFFRLDSSRTSETGGSGLGLAISKQIVELHGGTISAKSTTEHTDFIVTIPYRPAV